MSDELIIAKGNQWGSRRIGPLCRVIRETPKRVYVEVIEKNPSDCYGLGAVSGNGSNQYCDSGAILARNATREMWLAMIEAEVRLENRESKIYRLQGAARDEFAREIERIKKGGA